MRTITAPGVEIKEIDKSQYSPAMVGTTCYVMGFANKGEPYIPMEFTSRAAWISYFGEPDTEAEKYFYNACVEVLNQNGRLYCARLPYDNKSFEKMVGIKYTVDQGNAFPLTSIIADKEQSVSYDFAPVLSLDNSVDKAVYIASSGNPELVDLDKVDEYRTDEAKVTNGTFMIVDKTCAAYKKVQEDYRKGQKREMLGIVPVVTTALNAMYAQKLIQVRDCDAKFFETVGPCLTQNYENVQNIISSGSLYDASYNVKNDNLVRQLNSCYKNYQPVIDNHEELEYYNSFKEIYAGINTAISSINEKYRYQTIDPLNEDYAAISKAVEKYNAQVVPQCSVIWQKDKYLSAMIPEDKFESLKVDINSDTVQNLGSKVAQMNSYVNAMAEIHAEDGDDTLPNTVSFEANEFFSTIQYDPQLSAFDRTNLKKIGIVIYKAFIDPSEGNKIAFEPVEAFVGSLNKDDKDINTGVTTFMDTIVNTQSDYIYFFSNCFNTNASKLVYKNDMDVFVMKPTCSTGSLGFYTDQVAERISIAKSIYDGMDKCFEKVSDINKLDIDIVPDAGIANIASFIKSLDTGDIFEYDLNKLVFEEPPTPAVSLWKTKSNTDCVKVWKAVEQKFDNFCKNIRKDCMFIADGLRPMVLDGNKKIVRESKPKNNIDTNILPYVKFMTGLNTNYGAGYMDWFEVADEFTGDFFWCPPSIKAMGVYIYTDNNFQYWDAPAGLNRGIIAATDVAFSPTGKQAGAIYEKNWNYAINYPQDGIVLEGQKTFQVKPSAFDRVNVRRLFLRLERVAYKVARYFVYEGNTAYTRQRLVDALDPYFKAAKVGGGVYDYKIICDESINTPNVIDNNELKVKIGIKPTKTAEFILIDFIAVSTGGSFEEAMA